MTESSHSPVDQGGIIAYPALGSVVVGKYRVEACLAVGGMAMISQAVHVELAERVALKTLLPRYRNNAEILRRFRREARAVASLRSEHVARVHDFGMLEDGSPYLAMELLQGQDLEARLLERGPLAQTEAVDFVLQACEALAEAHAMGIVHRDLKPQNLFLTTAPDGSEILKVLDFGIAKTLKARGGHTTQEAVGTPHYMSPEQIRSSASVDARADIWTLGVILHELLTTRNVFEASTVSELVAMIEIASPKLSLEPSHSPALADVLLRCLQPERDARFSSILELAEALVPFGPAGAASRVARIRRIDQAARQRASFDWEDEVPPLALPAKRDPAREVATLDAGVTADRLRALRRAARWPAIVGMAAMAGTALFIALAPGSRAAQPLPITAAVPVPERGAATEAATPLVEASPRHAPSPRKVEPPPSPSSSPMSAGSSPPIAAPKVEPPRAAAVSASSSKPVAPAGMSEDERWFRTRK